MRAVRHGLHAACIWLGTCCCVLHDFLYKCGINIEMWRPTVGHTPSSGSNMTAVPSHSLLGIEHGGCPVTLPFRHQTSKHGGCPVTVSTTSVYCRDSIMTVALRGRNRLVAATVRWLQLTCMPAFFISAVVIWLNSRWSGGCQVTSYQSLALFGSRFCSQVTSPVQFGCYKKKINAPAWRNKRINVIAAPDYDANELRCFYFLELQVH